MPAIYHFLYSRRVCALLSECQAAVSHRPEERGEAQLFGCLFGCRAALLCLSIGSFLLMFR